MIEENIRLTSLSHGAGCGCKISPKILHGILASSLAVPDNKKLIVGNHTKDDAAVYDIGNDNLLISTTDFFMPIVDDPFVFGRIAGTNAISDVYAMGGDPILAIAILGWPVNKVSPSIASSVLEGGRQACHDAGIPLAGGHSIDSPEPIFGLAVNGIVRREHLKRNNTPQAGDRLYLTKALGVGIITTAEKKGIVSSNDMSLSVKQMIRLNNIGSLFGKIDGINALTDVTGFGLLGHLSEMIHGSGLGAQLYFNKIPQITPNLKSYIDKGAIPGGTTRNWESYGNKIQLCSADNEVSMKILADPQTSGGLLLSVSPDACSLVEEIMKDNGLREFAHPIGEVRAEGVGIIKVSD